MTTTTTKQSLALAKIRHLHSRFDVDVPPRISELIDGDETARDTALNIVDAWWHECFIRHRKSNDPRMCYVFAVAYYVRGNYDRSLHRCCICEGELVGKSVREVNVVYRSRLAEVESLVGKLVIEPPAAPTGAECGCNICVAVAS